MASLLIFYQKLNKDIKQILFKLLKNQREQNTFALLLQGQHYSDTKTRKGNF